MRIADASCEPLKWDRDPGQEPREGDVFRGRTILSTRFSVPAQMRFIRYRTPGGGLRDRLD